MISISVSELLTVILARDSFSFVICKVAERFEFNSLIPGDRAVTDNWISENTYHFSSPRPRPSIYVRCCHNHKLQRFVVMELSYSISCLLMSFFFVISLYQLCKRVFPKRRRDDDHRVSKMSSCSDHVDVAALSLPLPRGRGRCLWSATCTSWAAVAARGAGAAGAAARPADEPAAGGEGDGGGVDARGGAGDVHGARRGARGAHGVRGHALRRRRRQRGLDHHGAGRPRVAHAAPPLRHRLLHRRAPRRPARRPRACVDRLVRRSGPPPAAPSTSAASFLTAFNHTGNLVLSRDLLDMKEGEEFFYTQGG
uniref:Uncharacterized protein n=1 Tax=Ananas comosus var. bracteatus TaxID=296719 RepID=A0A6V7PZD8_ANACO|nr:unnamed protein product [Ananas comosus var. bracteatus]